VPQEGRFESGDCLLRKNPYSLCFSALYLEFFFLNSVSSHIPRNCFSYTSTITQFESWFVIGHCGRLICTLKYGLKKKKAPRKIMK